MDKRLINSILDIGCGKCDLLASFSNKFENAELLLEEKPGWRFLHEVTLDFNDVRLMISAAQYNLGNYTESLDTIRMLNPEFEADVSTVSGRRELLEEIERLRLIHG